MCSWVRYQTTRGCHMTSDLSVDTSRNPPDPRVPTIHDIQSKLVEIGDKPERFKNSHDWIGSFEACLILDSYFDIPCKMCHIAQGRNVHQHIEELCEHFTKFGSPVMMGARVWTPFRELLSIVEAALFKRQPDAIQDLDIALRKHKPDFVSLLKNPARSTHLRELLKQATTTGLQIHGEQRTQTFPQQFIDETIIISDLFELHEFAAVELLMAGDDQQANFPGLTRGLVAVLLYYDGHRSLVNALRALIKSREGRLWTLGLDEEVVSMTTRYTDDLLKHGLTNRILDLLSSMDLTKELEKLQKDRALGSHKHRKQVCDLYNEIRLSLAECLFCVACQAPLSKEDTLRLIQHLRLDNSTNPDGSLDHVTICLLMTLLYCFDVTVLELDTTEENSRQLSLPILTEPSYLEAIHKEMTSAQVWQNSGQQATAQFAWALTLRQLSQFQGLAGGAELCEDDEAIIDSAISHDLFLFLDKSVVSSSVFHEEEFYVRRVHSMITDFIFHMPLKWKELRNRGDESARIIRAHLSEGIPPPTSLRRDFEQMLALKHDHSTPIIRAHLSEGIPPPTSLRRDFEQMLALMSSVYGHDPLSLELSLDYWTTLDTYITPNSYTTQTQARPSPKQASLYKFLRLAGDMLPASLFVPYVNMLTGLSKGCQSSQHCFNLLHNNTVGSASPSNMVSWEHIFHSLNQYYTTLRREAPATIESYAPAYRSPHPRAITPEEIEGLTAVLRLIHRLAYQNENVRIALCENQDWMTVVLLFGLLSCTIPPCLKADILTTLAALAKTPEIASNMWQSLEMSQILPTVKTGTEQGGIQVELEEIEARAEEYPLTRAYLTLLHSLTDVPVPPALGAGHRLPGFAPYLKFVRDDVFLKFHSRAYKNPEEKWQVASCCLEVLSKLLSQYEPSASDFSEQYVQTPSGTDVASKSPGYYIIVHMLSESPLLKTIVMIIDEGMRLLETLTPSPEHTAMEHASLLALQIIQATMDYEPRFLHLLRESGSPVIVSSMDKLLMSVNQRTGVADHLVNITKYVTYNNSLPRHALAAVKILHAAAHTATIQSQLVALFTNNQTTHANILHGFVESIDADEVDGTNQNDDSLTQEETDSIFIRTHLSQEVLSLLLTSIKLPAPNLAHFLLGFELRKPVRKTTLQAPGILGAPKTCLHAILAHLNTTSPIQDTPTLTRLIYQLIFSLCADKETSVPFMRYLRTTWDLLYKQLQVLPFTSNGTSMLSHQTWLLKAIAIELRVTSLNRQRSHTHRLVQALISDSVSEVGAGDQTEQDTTLPDITALFLKRNVSIAPGEQTKRKLITLLDSLDFTQCYPNPLNLEFFDPALIEEVITSCQRRTDAGLVYYDVAALNRVLVSEVDGLQGTTMAAQRPLVMQEIETVLKCVASRNAVAGQLHEKYEGFKAWRELVEVVFCACPPDVMTPDTRLSVIIELLQQLLKKVTDENTSADLTSPISRVILTLSTNLMQCYHGDASPDQSRAAQFMSVLDAELSTNSLPIATTTGARTLYGTSLQIVLKGIVDYIFKAGGGEQGVRANLYGALLFYLQIAHKPKPQPTLTGNTGVARLITSKDTGEYDKLSQENVSRLCHLKFSPAVIPPVVTLCNTGVSRLLTSKDTGEFDKLSQENVSTLSSYGDNLLDIICRDSCDGNDVSRMLALCVLGDLITLDKLQQWLNFISSKGYLQHLVDSLLDDDNHLQSVVTNNPGSLKVLYIYQSKMCALSRIASSQYGANLLLRSGLLHRLSQCSFLDMRPDNLQSEKQRHPTFDDNTPTAMTHYQQLLEPALSLCLSILTSAGVDNVDARGQVMELVVSHIDVIQSILRSPYTTLDMSSLRELALTTAVLSRSVYHDEGHDFLPSEAAMLEYRGHVTRIQRLMIGLLGRLTNPDCARRLLSTVAPDNHEFKAQVTTVIQEVVANTVTFCRNLLMASGTSAKNTPILFGPDMADAFTRDTSMMEDFNSSSLAATHQPNLGLVVFLLKDMSRQFTEAFDAHQTTTKKIHTLPDLNNEDLRQLSGVDVSEKSSSQHRMKLASQALQSQLAMRVADMQRLSYSLENLVYLLWRHLEYYLLHCVSMEQQPSLYQAHVRQQTQLRRLNEQSESRLSTPSYTDEFDVLDERTRGVSRDEILLLKNQAATAINDTLLKKLHDIYQTYGKTRSSNCFMDAMVRRVKRLVSLHTTTK